MNDELQSKASPEEQDKARQIGWRPPTEFRGDPTKWVDADEFLRRGEEVLPLVKAENRRLHEKTDSLSREISRLTQVVTEQQQSMNDMREFSLQQLQERLAEQKRKITAELREARKEDDDLRVEQLEEQLEENAERRNKLKDATKPAPQGQQAAPQTPAETPEYREWVAANPWFGGTSREDQAKTAAAERFGVEAAAAGKRGKAFFDAVDEAMAEVYPPKARRQDPSEDGRPSGGGTGSSGSSDKGFNALPPEAKAKAREQAPRFVGPNKMFKDEKAWFAYYAQQYNVEAA